MPLFIYVCRKMSDSDSLSDTDSDNNNVFPFYNHYLGLHRYDQYENPELENSSDSEHPLDQHSDSSSSANVNYLI